MSKLKAAARNALPASAPDAGAPEIEITPEMVEAGETILDLACDALDPPAPLYSPLVVRDIYTAMRRLEPPSVLARGLAKDAGGE